MFLPALMALHRLTRERFGDVIARRTITYLAISPLSFVFSMVYTESLALLLICGTFLLLERRRIVGACAVGALATLARPVGIILAPAIALAGVRNHRPAHHRPGRSWPPPARPPGRCSGHLVVHVAEGLQDGDADLPGGAEARPAPTWI